MKKILTLSAIATVLLGSGLVSAQEVDKKWSFGAEVGRSTIDIDDSEWSPSGSLVRGFAQYAFTRFLSLDVGVVSADTEDTIGSDTLTFKYSGVDAAVVFRPAQLRATRSWLDGFTVRGGLSSIKSELKINSTGTLNHTGTQFGAGYDFKVGPGHLGLTVINRELADDTSASELRVGYRVSF